MVVVTSREKVEGTLVDAMEGIDSGQGAGQSEDGRPTLMFKIASKSKKEAEMLLF